MPGDNCVSPPIVTVSWNNSSATSARWLHVILFVVGLAGWLVFILACAGGPAWSPDGSQILFAYRDVANSRTSIALYDRATGSISTIFAQPVPGGDDGSEGEVILYPRWQNDGKRALVAIWHDRVPNATDENACELMSLPVKSKIPPQVYNLGFTPNCIYPMPQIMGKVYFGGRELGWIDLATGEVGSKAFNTEIKFSENDGVVLFEDNGRLYYQRHLSRKVSAAGDKQQEEEGAEIGRLQLEDFSLRPSFAVWPQNLSALGVQGSVAEDLSTIFLSPNGSAGAMIAIGKENNSDEIVFTEEGKGVVRVLAPDLGVRPFKLGELVWSQDGRTLYASAVTLGQEKGVLNYGFAEIPVEGGRARFTRVSVVRSEFGKGDFDNIFRTSMPVSLSPDGRWIAATPAVLGKGKIDDRDRALFLIDLRDPARRMKRVPIPRQPPAAGPAKKANP